LISLNDVASGLSIGQRRKKIFRGPQDTCRGNQMLDIGMIAIGVGFFVASILYVLACERM
jgi:hypothetical protein